VIAAAIGLLAALMGGCSDAHETDQQAKSSTKAGSASADAERHTEDWRQSQANPRRTGTLATEGVPEIDDTKWTYSAGGTLSGSPVVADGVVYVGGSNEVLHAVDADTGEAKWTTQVGYIHSAAAVYGDYVYVTTGGFAELHAVDKANGEVAWSASIGFVGASSPRAPAVADGKVYVSNGDKGLYAFDADTGEQRWRQELGERRLSKPAVGDERVYVATSELAAVAIDRATGEIAWRSGIEAGGGNGPTVTEASVIASPSAPTKVFALNKENGRKLQTFPGDNDGLTSTSTAVTDERIFVGRATNRLYAYSRSSGQELWRYQANHTIFGSPAVVGETVYVTSADGVVHAVDVTSGEGRWHGDLNGKSMMPGVAVSDGVVYAAGPHGHLYAMH
jgi:outer membrane protein assembly factor BamB